MSISYALLLLDNDTALYTLINGSGVVGFSILAFLEKKNCGQKYNNFLYFTDSPKAEELPATKLLLHWLVFTIV